MKNLIFIAEDEENIRELLRCTLESYAYDVKCFSDGVSIKNELENTKPDLILLDIMMPGIDGITLLRTIKTNKATASIPVIMITAKTSEVDKVIGLDSGADDYITKPFGLLELTARVRTALRRTQPEENDNENIIILNGIKLNPFSREVKLRDTEIELTLKEFELLYLLMKKPNCVITRDELLNHVWGYDYVGETRTLDMHIKTLRSKLGDDAECPKYIKTIRGIGYKFIG
ncbi:MAG TPA: DNA-binding response regulator [Ruminococcaceae bacterium]|nr:DNA-binding response regulator [Oscillospiraceae bacterium]